MQQRKLSDYEIRKLAVLAYCDERTMKRFLAGAPVRGMAAARIEQTLREQGIELPPQGEPRKACK